jgi:hypothetical protein
MIRSAASRALLLTAAMLAIGGIGGVSCSGKKSTHEAHTTGAVDLALMTSPGVTINTVSYTITGNGITPITGSIDVSAPGATVSLLISGIPVGTNYKIDLAATSTDGKTTCGGSANFDITAGGVTSVNVALQCRGPSVTGSVAVTGTINNCPVLTSYVVAPLTTEVGGAIKVNATASDLDAGSTLTYAWSTNGGGSFDTPAQAAATFTCTPRGSQTLKVAVSDGKCTTDAEIAVNCGSVCGNGVVEPGETCEPPNSATCNANCQVITGTGGTGGATGGTGGATGGTGGATGGTGGATGGTGGATGGTGGATGGTGGATGGTGGATGGTGGATGGTGGATGGTGGAAGGTGGATGGTGGATGGTGGATGGTGGTGGDPNDPTAACDACVAANCTEDGPGCGSLATPAKQALCTTLSRCIRRTDCNTASNSICWCGTTSIPQCTSGGAPATGVCKDEEVAAAESTDPAQISQRFTNPTFASGAAHNRFACEKDFCATECATP